MDAGENERSLQALIDVLAKRYKAQVSEESHEDSIEHRVVLVIGAGVSLASGLPLWSNPALKERLLAVAEGHFRDLQGFVDAAWDSLGPKLGLPPTPDLQKPAEARERLREDASLEELCAIACADPILREKILDELVGWFAPWSGTIHPSDGGPPPQLAYELIAHLVKHRFIDHIISFNFDEVLDSAVASEMAPEDYVLITSDHHMLSTEQPIKPHVIKVHGTISRRETLRFTAPQTGALTREMRRLLDRIIFAPPTGAKKLQVDIISFGYSWQDKDFAHYVYQHRADIGTVVVVMAQPEDNANAMIRPEILYPGKQTAGAGRFTRFINSNAFAPGRIPSADLVLWSAWEGLAMHLKEDYSVMPIARHLILASIFAQDWTRLPGASSSKAPPLDWIAGRRGTTHARQARFRAELLLHTIECKGMVNVSVMAHNCRLNRYRPRSPGNGKDILTPIDFLKRGWSGDFKETYFADAHTVDDLCATLKQHFPVPDGAVVNVPRFDPAAGLTFEPVNLHEFLEGKKYKVGKVAEVFDGEEIEVVPSADPRSLWVFSAPATLTTYLELQHRTAELLESKAKRWTDLFVVAESGAWMLAPRIDAIFKKRDVESSVLCIDIQVPREWALREEITRRMNHSRTPEGRVDVGKCRILFAQLPWWQHNRHLTLAYDRSSNAFTGGIFFRRILRASQIAPVFVENANDCAELFMTFMSYARRVCEEQERPGQELRNPSLANFLEILIQTARRVSVPDLGELLERLCSQLALHLEQVRKRNAPN